MIHLFLPCQGGYKHVISCPTVSWLSLGGQTHAPELCPLNHLPSSCQQFFQLNLQFMKPALREASQILFSTFILTVKPLSSTKPKVMFRHDVSSMVGKKSVGFVMLPLGPGIGESIYLRKLIKDSLTSSDFLTTKRLGRGNSTSTTSVL